MGEDRCLSTSQMISYYSGLCGEFPLTLIEDGLDQDDFNGLQSCPARFPVCRSWGTICLQPIRAPAQEIERRSANAVLLKINQIGTVTEAIKTARTASKKDGCHRLPPLG